MEILTPSIPDTPPVAVDKWTADLGINRNTVWQWQKRGGLKTVNSAGRHYLTAAQHPEAGEFAQAPCDPLFRHRARIEIRGRS